MPTSQYAKHQEYAHIGVLGGMGIEAGTDLVNRVQTLFIEKSHTKGDDDFPESSLISIPCHIVGVETTNRELVINQLVEGCKRVEATGADFIVTACNSAHVHYPEMQAAVNIPVINLVEECAKKAAAAGMKKVVTFGVGYGVENDMFTVPFRKYGVEVITPTKQEIDTLNGLCDVVVSRKITEGNKMDMLDLINRYTNRADGVGLFCTELPILFNMLPKDQVTLPTIDSIQVGAEVAYKYSTNPKQLREDFPPEVELIEEDEDSVEWVPDGTSENEESDLWK